MLSAIGWLYGKIANVRNSLYAAGTLKSYALGVPTVSVGNITVGGTGKTPLVIKIARILAARGEKVCVISRGYKRQNENRRVLVSDGSKILTSVEKAGDEPFEIAAKLTGKAFVLADANRAAGGIWAKKNFGITAFVLDDAFQHRKVKRDLDIVVIDAAKPFGNKRVLPAGILREPLANLKRADLIILTRANLCKNTGEIVRMIKSVKAEIPIIFAENKTSKIFNLKNIDSGKDENIESVKDKKLLAFCALGNPANFFNQLKRENFQIQSTETFPDHYFYLKKDIRNLERKLQTLKAGALITTLKDAVKINAADLSIPCYVLESEIIFDDEKKLHRMIDAVLENYQK